MVRYSEELALAVAALKELATDPRDEGEVCGDGWAFYTDTVIFARDRLAEIERRIEATQ